MDFSKKGMFSILPSVTSQIKFYYPFSNNNLDNNTLARPLDPAPSSSILLTVRL